MPSITRLGVSGIMHAGLHDEGGRSGHPDEIEFFFPFPAHQGQPVRMDGSLNADTCGGQTLKLQAKEHPMSTILFLADGRERAVNGHRANGARVAKREVPGEECVANDVDEGELLFLERAHQQLYS